MNGANDMQALDGAGLTASTQRAVDALAANGWDAGRVAEAERAEAEAVLRVLECLHTQPGSLDAEATAALVAATLARVEASDCDMGFADPLDEDALESLIANELDLRRVPSALRERAEEQLGVLRTLGEGGERDTAGREQLVKSTLGRVALTAAQPVVRTVRHEGGWRVGPRTFRLTDLVGMAAMLLVGTSVLVPVFAGLREQARHAACVSNLGQVAGAFGKYGGDNRDALPMAFSAGPAARWWSVGVPGQSNSQHYYKLYTDNYTELENLACPGNQTGCFETERPGTFDFRCITEVSFSFRSMFADHRPTLSQVAGLPVFGDRSPVVPVAMRGMRINPFANSANHGGRGQNLLLGNGAAVWVTGPAVSTAGGNLDNIWLPRPVERAMGQMLGIAEMDPLRGTERPTSMFDVFLNP